MEMRWKPLLAWTDAQQMRAASTVGAAWQEWRQGWLSGSDGACAVRCVEAHEAGDGRWELLGRAAHRAAWIRSIDPARLERELFGPEAAATKSRIARDVATRARAALHAELARAAGVDVASGDDIALPPAGLFVPWSGATVVRLDDAIGVEVLLDSDCMRELAGAGQMRATELARNPVLPLGEALSGRKLRLNVEVAGCELTLGELTQLRVDDVISLPHELDEPLQVTVSGQRLCAAYLGRLQGAKAVELAREPD